MQFPLPVRIFKDNDLKTSNIKVIKELNSSGTSGSKSKIYLDKENSINQSKVLSKIMKNNIGGDRLPMLIVDKRPKSSNILSASSAAINGFSIFGKDHIFNR